MEILTILKANIRHRKGAFVSIAILVFIIALTITSLFSLDNNVKKNLLKSLEAVDTGDFVAFYNTAKLSDTMLEKVTQNEHVERIRKVPALGTDNYHVNGREPGSGWMLEEWQGEYSVFAEEQQGFIDNPPDLKAGEMYVPIAFQMSYDCEVGTEVVIDTSAGQEKFVVKGFIEEPFVGAYVIGFKQVFLSKEDFSRLSKTLGEAGSNLLAECCILHIYQAKDSSLSSVEFKKILNKESGVSDGSNITLSIDDSMHYTNMFIQIGIGILAVFIILLFLIVLIVMGHSVSTGIEMDYVNLGILKSQGYTKGKIRLIFILQYTLAMLIGVIMGIVLAIPLTKYLGQIFQPITGILATADVALGQSALLIAVIVLFGILFVSIKTAKIGKISPVNAISGGRDSVYFDSRFKLPISKKMLSPSLSLRQFTSGQKQYISAMLIVAILVFFMMSITILVSSMNSETAAETYGNYNYEVELQLKETFSINQKAEICDEIEKITPVTLELYMTTGYMAIEDENIYCFVYENPQLFSNCMVKGREPLYENEIILTEIVAEELDKKIGDTVIISRNESSAEYLISGYFQHTNDLGRCFGMSADGVKRLGDIKLGWGEIGLEDESKAEAVTKLLNDKFGDVLTAVIAEPSNGLGETMDAAFLSLNVVIYVISVVFALVVVQMICRRTFLQERNDIGIYKAIGFSTTRLRLQFAIRFLIVAILGGLIGVVMCLLFSQNLVGLLLRMLGVTHFISQYNAFIIGVPTIMICLCFFVFAYLSSGRIKQVSARELVTE